MLRVRSFLLKEWEGEEGKRTSAGRRQWRCANTQQSAAEKLTTISRQSRSVRSTQLLILSISRTVPHF
ncbi:hypothetical protein J6590_011084 [Homalodisca vitripennis]|nr:hypothetical protein J6590_011084 [Homalodisca vitripennis]